MPYERLEPELLGTHTHFAQSTGPKVQVGAGIQSFLHSQSCVLWQEVMSKQRYLLFTFGAMSSLRQCIYLIGLLRGQTHLLPFLLTICSSISIKNLTIYGGK